VFFDNVYAIGGDNAKHITENSPISPNSKKVEVRAFVDKHILGNIEKGSIEAIIARAPDFFGPIKEKIILMNMIYDNFAKGKSAQWFCNADVVHTTGFTPDLAKGTALLGNTNEAYNQIWNLPVDQSPITGREWAELFAIEMNVKNNIQVLPGWGLRFIGLFVPILGEMYEMRYQYDRTYFFVQKSKCGKTILQRKFYYLFTCEYCFSHYIALAFLILTQYHLLFADWRGYLIGGFALVWIANIYMSLFGLIRVGMKKEKMDADIEELKLNEIRKKVE